MPLLLTWEYGLQASQFPDERVYHIPRRWRAEGQRPEPRVKRRDGRGEGEQNGFAECVADAMLRQLMSGKEGGWV